MDKLTSLDAPGLNQTLAQVFQDDSQNTVLRDYALQHLIEKSQLDISRGGSLTSAQLQELRNALWQAVRETDTSIGGTPLPGLRPTCATATPSARSEVCGA